MRTQSDIATITCPHCNRPFEITDALRASVETQLREGYSAEIEALNEAHTRALAEAETKAAARTEVLVQERYAVDMTDLRRQVEEQKSTVKALQKEELRLRQQAREIEAQKQSLELEIVRRVDSAREEAARTIRDQVAHEHAVKEREKDLQIEGMRRQIEELQRKASQGSQQLQGEAAEQCLQDRLESAFPQDGLDPVPTGIRGADLVQLVRDQQGRAAGIVVWESKRTKGWSKEWPSKLRADMQRLGGDLGVIVTDVMPNDSDQYLIDGDVVIIRPALVEIVATMLRRALIDVARARRQSGVQADRQALVFAYLTSPECKRRVEALLASLTEMQQALERERRAMQKHWTNREKQLRVAADQVVGLWGDLHGIAGAALPAIAHLELPDPEAVGQTD
jgi:hypothetical protein